MSRSLVTLRISIVSLSGGAEVSEGLEGSKEVVAVAVFIALFPSTRFC